MKRVKVRDRSRQLFIVEADHGPQAHQHTHNANAMQAAMKKLARGAIKDQERAIWIVRYAIMGI